MDTDLCYYCQNDVETCVHLLFQCPIVKTFWSEVKDYMEEFSNAKVVIKPDTVIWNNIVEHLIGHIKNYICLLAKQFIYRVKCMKEQLNIHKFKAIVRETENIEKYYAMKINRLRTHEKKWSR